MAKVLIPTPLRKFTADQVSFETNASTVFLAIKYLAAAFPEIQKYLFDENGQIRNFILIYLGDEYNNVLDKEKTVLSSNDELSIILAIAGGKK
jgi:sulfur-carrier protein